MGLKAIVFISGGGGGGGGTIGQPVTGGTPNELLYIDGSGDLADLSGSNIGNADWAINLNNSLSPITSASPNFDGFFESGGADSPVPIGTVWEAKIYSYKIISGTEYYSTTFLGSGAPYTTTEGQILGYTWDADTNADGYLVLNNVNGSGFVYSIDVGNSLSYDTQSYGWPGNSATDPPTPTGVSVATYLNYVLSGVLYGLYTGGPILSGGGTSNIADLILGTPLTPANGGLGTTDAALNDLSGSASVAANVRQLYGAGGIGLAIDWSNGYAILYTDFGGLPGTSIDAGQQFLYYSPGRGSPIFLDYGNGIMYDTSGNAVITATLNSITVKSVIYSSIAAFTSEGQVWKDSTQLTLAAFMDGIRQNFVGCIYSATANSGPANTGTETTIIGTGIGTKTLPVNFFVAGKSLRIKGGGVFTTPISPGNLVINVKYGSVVLASATISTLAVSTTNGGFEYDITLSCRTIGTSGTVMTVGKIDFDLTAATQGTANLNNAGSTATINTTTANAIDVTATWSTSTTSTITGAVATIEVLN